MVSVLRRNRLWNGWNLGPHGVIDRADSSLACRHAESLSHSVARFGVPRSPPKVARSHARSRAILRTANPRRPWARSRLGVTLHKVADAWGFAERIEHTGERRGYRRRTSKASNL